jgi:hypothetical protein
MPAMEEEDEDDEVDEVLITDLSQSDQNDHHNLTEQSKMIEVKAASDSVNRTEQTMATRTHKMVNQYQSNQTNIIAP